MDIPYGRLGRVNKAGNLWLSRMSLPLSLPQEPFPEPVLAIRVSAVDSGPGQEDIGTQSTNLGTSHAPFSQNSAIKLCTTETEWKPGVRRISMRPLDKRIRTDRCQSKIETKQWKGAREEKGEVSFGPAFQAVLHPAARLKQLAEPNRITLDAANKRLFQLWHDRIMLTSKESQILFPENRIHNTCHS